METIGRVQGLRCSTSCFRLCGCRYVIRGCGGLRLFVVSGGRVPGVRDGGREVAELCMSRLV